MQQNHPQSKKEENVNALTHLAGSIAFVYLSIISSTEGQLAYSLIFAMMFFSSFLYHIRETRKTLFRTVDQFFIYVVIGATGLIVPDLLTSFEAVFFLSILGLTFIHHILRQVLSIPEGFIVPLLYLINGIICSYFLIFESSHVSSSLIFGICFYLVGFCFYVNDHIQYFHSAWHIMCVLGAYHVYLHISSPF